VRRDLVYTGAIGFFVGHEDGINAGHAGYETGEALENMDARLVLDPEAVTCMQRIGKQV
jgi:hypothetical protein